LVILDENPFLQFFLGKVLLFSLLISRGNSPYIKTTHQIAFQSIRQDFLRKHPHSFPIQNKLLPAMKSFCDNSHSRRVQYQPRNGLLHEVKVLHLCSCPEMIHFFWFISFAIDKALKVFIFSVKFCFCFKKFSFFLIRTLYRVKYRGKTWLFVTMEADFAFVFQRRKCGAVFIFLARRNSSCKCFLASFLSKTFSLRWKRADFKVNFTRRSANLTHLTVNSLLFSRAAC